MAHIREVDAIAHVVRCFEDPEVAHVDGGVDPIRDIDVVETELSIADLESAERTLSENAKSTLTLPRSELGFLRESWRLWMRALQ